MLPKTNRLTKKKDFEAAFKKGESMKSDFLLFKVAPNHLSESRFGFIVSKKVSGKAVVRNKVKRRLRKAVEDVLKSFHQSSPGAMAPKSKDVIIISLPTIVKKEFLEIKQVITDSFKKLKIT